MASIETVDFGSFGKAVQTNISYTVGPGEKNERNDVMLIQTLFQLIGMNDTFSQGLIGLETKDLPEPSGVYDTKTTRAIWGFQRQRPYRLIKPEGKVHPASYQNRVLKKGPQARQMMITVLNLTAAQVGQHTDLISAVRKISPSIVFTAPHPPKTP